MTTFSNLKTYLPAVLQHLFGYNFKHLWKKRNIIVTFQLTEQPKTLDDLDRFDLKFYLNCPIRIEIITVRGKIFRIKCQPVVKTI
jgi:hypothetical protein